MNGIWYTIFENDIDDGEIPTLAIHKWVINIPSDNYQIDKTNKETLQTIGHLCSILHTIFRNKHTFEDLLNLLQPFDSTVIFALPLQIVIVDNLLFVKQKLKDLNLDEKEYLPNKSLSTPKDWDIWSKHVNHSVSLL